MKASELITRLQQLMAEHGDLEVARYDIDYGTFFTFNETDVEKRAQIEYIDYPNEPTGPYIGIGS